MSESELRPEQVFRPPYARTLSVVWFALAVFVALDAVLNGSGRAVWVSLSVIGLSVAIVYALAFRPAVVADDTGVTLRNVAKDVRIPWASVEGIGATWSLTVEAEGRTWASWAITARNRQRADAAGRSLLGGSLAGGSRSGRMGPPAPPGRTPGSSTGGTGAPQTAGTGGGYVSAELSRRWEEATGAADAAPSAPRDAAPSDGVTVTWAVPVLAALGVTTLSFVLALIT
jgi:hypothetical protein